MEVHIFFLQLVIILISAKVLGEIAAYFKAPPVIGELAAGILIGPSVMGWVLITAPIHLLAQIGIILLLFEVGIETDIGRLTAAGKKAFVVALAGVILPFVFGFCITYCLFNFSMLASLFIGSTLTATSIGITLRVLRDLKKQNTSESQIIIGAAVLDDIIGIVLLAVLYEFSMSGSVNLLNAGKVAIFIALFFLICPLVSKLFSLAIKKWGEKTKIPGLLPGVIFSLILFFSWLAHVIGAPELLGGFIVGLALSRKFIFPFANSLPKAREFSVRVEEEMKPIVHLFTPIFFVSVGLSLDLKSINWNSNFIWIFTSLLLIGAIIGKLLSGFFLKDEPFKSKLAIGASMVPRGEVGLIFANIGLVAGVLKDDVYASVVLVIALTTLLAPFALRYIYGSQRKGSVLKFFIKKKD